LPKRNVAIAAFKQKALIVGASGRMASEMLARLGFACSVADLYADRDTHLICEGRVTKLQALSDLERVERIVREHDFVVFTGGLEGNAAIADTLSRWAKPAFTSSNSLENLADYRILNQAMTEAGVDRYPLSQNPPSDKGKSVFKNLCHSGTARLATAEDRSRSAKDSYVFQEYISGESISLIFVAKDAAVTCLGESKQLVDPGNNLMWVGSISGISGSFLNPNERASANRFANSLAILAGITGVFGIDFMQNETGVWPVDVNPRIPASAEVIGDHVMQNHLQAFGIECPPVAESSPLCLGKKVIFNPSANPVRFNDAVLEQLSFRFSNPCSPTSIADVPQRDEVIAPNHPICTVLASGDGGDAVLSNLVALQTQVLLGLGIGKH